MASHSLASSSLDVSLPFSTADTTSTQSTSVVSSGSSPSSVSIPPLPSFSHSLPLHTVGPSILPASSIGQISLPSCMPYAGTTEPTIPSHFHSVAALAVPNITNLVTIKLNSVEDYLTWRTQFTSLLISHELLGFVDGSTPQPTQFLCNVSGNQQVTPLYRSWVRVDQSVRSWLFATLSREVLVDVHLLPTSRDIWLSLHRRFMDASQAKSIELKRQLTTMRKSESMTIDQYLREAKTIADSLAAINSPVSSQDLIDHVLLGLGREYDTLVGIITHFPGQLSLEELRTKLLLHEQRLQRFKELDSGVSHQAFAAQNVSLNSSSASQGGRGKGRSSSYRGRGRGGRGRGSFGGRNQQHFTSSNSPRNNFQEQSSSGMGSVSPIPYNSQSASSTSPSSGVLGAHPSSTSCQICGYPGHSALQCTNRFNHAFVANDLPKSFATMSVGETNDATWYFDSAASAHMTPSEGNFLRKSPYTGLDRVLVGNGTLLDIKNIGYSKLPSISRPLHLHSMFHVPQLRHNLISVKKLCKDNNCSIDFDSSSVSVKDKATGQTLLQASSEGDVYPLASLSVSSHSQACVAIRQSGDIWLRRLGHSGVQILDCLRKNNYISLLNSVRSDCVPCRLGKSQRLPFKLVDHCSSSPLDIIHSDVWQSPVLSNLGFKYYVVFVDDFSRFTWLYPMKNKSEVFLHFCAFQKLAENIFNTKI